MSNALLLTVIGMAITGIILGMKVALSIIRSVPMFGGGYPAVMPANQPINATAEKSGSSLGFTFLLLVFFIGCVLWIVTNPAYNTTPKAAPDTQQPKQENNIYKVIIASFTTENLAKTYQDDHPVLAEGFVREFIISA